MPDTENNQAEYPQQKAQKEGLGFPIVRMVVLLSLATAMVSGMALAPYSGKETGEGALLRQLLEQLDANDILLADCYFCSYFMIALLLAMGVDFVAKLHHARNEKTYRVKRLGKGDYLIEWQRPSKPPWMDRATYDQMPESLTLRQINVTVSQQGFRTESLVVVTTLTDSVKYTREDIAELYHKRWLIELDIRAIKCNLGMDVLRCKSPEMVRKEIWVYLLAYNLLRKTMLQSAMQNNLSPRQLSFTSAMQTIVASWGTLPLSSMIAVQLASLSYPLIGGRPDRIEPRAVKRRPKPYRLLTMPRSVAREKLMRGVDPYERRK